MCAAVLAKNFLRDFRDVAFTVIILSWNLALGSHRKHLETGSVEAGGGGILG